MRIIHHRNRFKWNVLSPHGWKWNIIQNGWELSDQSSTTSQWLDVKGSHRKAYLSQLELGSVSDSNINCTQTLVLVIRTTNRISSTIIEVCGYWTTTYLNTSSRKEHWVAWIREKGVQTISFWRCDLTKMLNRMYFVNSSSQNKMTNPGWRLPLKKSKILII